MKWPIFIPSRGRPTNSTARILPTATVVVEPGDYESYVAAGIAPARLHQLPEGGRGIAFVREYILNLNRTAGAAWYWMLDDDISGFCRTVNSRNQNIPADEALSEAEGLIESQVGIGQAALEYAQFAWSSKRPVKIVGYCDVAVAINTRLTRNCRYRAEMNLKEDRDFTLQVLANGAKTMRCAMLSFKAPKNGSNAGGLHDVYAQRGREEAAVDRMVTAWPQCVSKQIKPDGRIDCKIKWAAYR